MDGADDEKIAAYLDSHGTEKTPDEVKAWSDSMDRHEPLRQPGQKRMVCENVTKPLGLDPATTPMFDWLEADDKMTIAAK